MEWNRMLEALRCLKKYFMSKTPLEQFLIIVSLILFISFLILLLLIVATRSSSKESGQEGTVCVTEGCLNYDGTEDLCTTVACVRHAINILEKMDPSIDPCDDFYEFACGSYRKHYTFSGGKRAHKVEDDIETEIYAILRSLLTSNKHFRNRSFKNAKAFYKCCIEGTDEFDGISDLILQILKTSDIQWASAVSNREWKKAVVKMILYGSYPFYDISIDIDNDRILAKLDKPQVGTKQTLISESAFEYSTGEYRQIQNDYMNLIESIIVLTEKALNTQRLLDEDENCTSLHEMADKFFKLEKYLAQDVVCSTSRPLFRKPVCETMKDETKWVAAFVDEAIPNSLHGHKLKVACKCSYYIDVIEEMLKSNRIFRYYALWRHLARYLPLVSSSFRHSYMRLYEAMNPFNKDITSYHEARYFSEKWKQCVYLTNDIYGLALAQIYKNEGYHEDDDDEIFILVESILNVYGKMFASTSSLDNETVTDFMEKLESLVVDINYPDIILDEFRMDDYYLEKSEYYNERCNPVKQVQHPKSCFIYDLLKNECIKVKTNLLNEWYEQQLNGSSFAYIPPVSSRVHVDFERNIMTIPVGMMRSPYYTPHFFKFAKYGGISSLIIRELSRKIQAELLDEDDDSRDIIHHSGKRCLMKHVESFNNGKESEMSSDRNWEEVILDNIALKVAYELYQTDDESEQGEPKLPNLDYNSDQLFFIQYAQMHCEIRNNTFSIFDRSIPAKFRVNNAMMNKKEFSDAFECPEESPMNPSKRCRIWV